MAMEFSTDYSYVCRIRSLEVDMKPSSRQGVNKHSSAKQFRRDSSRTKALNMAPRPMRGGFRI